MIKLVLTWKALYVINTTKRYLISLMISLYRLPTRRVLIPECRTLFSVQLNFATASIKESPFVCTNRKRSSSLFLAYRIAYHHGLWMWVWAVFIPLYASMKCCISSSLLQDESKIGKSACTEQPENHLCQRESLKFFRLVTEWAQSCRRPYLFIKCRLSALYSQGGWKGKRESNAVTQWEERMYVGKTASNVQLTEQ